MDHEAYMRRALELAAQAAEQGMCRWGVIVRDGRSWERAATAGRRMGTPPPTRNWRPSGTPAAGWGSWRLHRCTMYVTLEPLPHVCRGIINARIGTVRYGAKDDKAGACGSVLNLFEERFNHRPRLYRGPMEAECGRALRAFFEDLREKTDFRGDLTFCNICG